MQTDKKSTRSGRARASAALLIASLLAALSAAGCLARAMGDSRAEAGSIAYEAGKGPLFLVGEWERREGFVDEAELATPAEAPSYAMVSFRATQYLHAPEAPGQVTYRLTIELAGALPEVLPGAAILRSMALYAPCLQDFEAAYIDGRLAYDRRSAVSPSPLLFFTPEGDTVTITLRSGPGDRRLEEAMLVPPVLLFGEAGEVDRFQVFAIGAAILEASYFLLLGIISFLLFLFWKKNREFLGFSVYMLTAFLFFAFKNAIAFQFIPGGTGLGWLGSAYTAALDLQYLALAFFLWTIYRSRVHIALRIASFALPALLAAAAFAFPGAGRALAFATIAYLCLFAVAVIAWLSFLIARGDANARWLVPAFCAMGATVVAKASLPPSFAISFYLAPTGLMIFGLACSLMLVKKVGDSFETVETLSDYVTSVSATVRSFIPREFLEYLEKADVTDLRLGDHVKKEMTIFFSDIRAFTELSERLTVEENFAFINSYLSRVVPIIRENGGFVDKYLGDGILALYPGDAGPDEAIRSAIAMQGKILEYNGHRAKMGYCPIAMGVGIHTGALMLGVVGVSDRMENTVISDAVNLASRLQAITKAFNIAVAISEQAFKELEDPGSYKYRFIGKVRVKGKAAPVSVFEIFDGIAPDLFERKMKANTFFEQGMLSYYQKDFAGAMYYFKRVLDIIPEDGAAGFYLDNCMNKATA